MGSSQLDPALALLAQRISDRPGPGGRIRLASRRVRTLRRRLKKVYAGIHASLASARLASRAEEWLLDNRHVIEDALETLESNLPDSYMRQLAGVRSSKGGLVLVHAEALARELLEAGQLPIDLDWVQEQVDRYQDLTNLKIGELWALPSLLALCVVEQLLDRAEILVDSETVGAGIQEQQDDSEKAAGRVAGLVISLRNIEAHDWHGFFESVSRVDRILNEDPVGAYKAMDFASRNRYRSRIEALARGAKLRETEVARAVIGLAEEAGPADNRARHVGYYLIGGGRPRLERNIGFRPAAREWLFRFADRRPNLCYFSLFATLFLAPMSALWFGLRLTSVAAPALPALLLLLSIPAAGLAMLLLNGLLTWLLPPRVLSRLDFEAGIPESFRTAVVMPVLLGDADEVEQVFEKLEINFLANRDSHLVHAVLGDFVDADQRGQPEDDAILTRARTCLERLQRRYGSDRFMFLCRHRQWNSAESCWMGWERKRGKLMEFNRLLAGKGTSYDCILGERSALDGVRFVITLDTDTRMPPGTAAQLIGTMAHPLSLAWFEPAQPGLLGGYSIIQPRLEIDPDSASISIFTRIFSGDNTLDLYTHASSDAYHDLFGEGIFSGKGIYDWQAIEHCLDNRIPENSVLSHDLLEGIHGRVGLVTDLILLEQFPPTSVTWMRRLHRWVRGDWQLLPWLSPRPRRADRQRVRNTLALIHRWKIFDNLRRSLLAPATLVLLLMAFLGFLPGDPLVWVLVIAALLAAPLWSDLLTLATRVANRPMQAPGLLLSAPTGLLRQLGHWLVSLALLPWHSQVLLDAIGRTLYRKFISRRHLLEWTTAAHVHRRIGKQPKLDIFVRELWFSLLLSITTLIGILLLNPAGLVVALPFLLTWLLSPLLVRRLDRLQQARPVVLDDRQQRLLRTTARRTWLFFRRFVEPDNHWLAPDNYQEEPRVALARRTSPTNMGMSLNAGLAAHDFGWLDLQTLIAWLDNSMDRMANLERYRGHWLNWYETENLRALNPRYVSTVDSGNLAAALITLARGLDEIARQPLKPQRLLNGIADTLAVIRETLIDLPGDSRRELLLEPILDMTDRLIDRLVATDAVLTDSLLESLQSNDVEQITEQILALSDEAGIDFSPEALHQLRVWLEELEYEMGNAREHIRTLMPWLTSIGQLPGLDHARQVASWRALEEQLIEHWVLADAAEPGGCRIDDLIDTARDDPGLADAGLDAFFDALRGQIHDVASRARTCRDELNILRRRADRWLDEMDFAFLYDTHRHLFRIGHDVSSGMADQNHYDLLASEARLASLVAIGKSDVPLRHWLYLGRPFRRQRGRRVLMSWGATLFEYLMPGLYTRTPRRSLIDRAGRAAIRMHRGFSARRGLPWGISESGYYQFDQQGHYQYRSFGVPKLGFRRDLGDRLVIAPYASIMALPFMPHAVIENLENLRKASALGLYGFHEAVDYGRREKLTPRRGRVVRSWMSHHQGMILMAIDNFLNDEPMIRRFHADRRMAGASLVLHERMPRTLPRLEASRQPRMGPPVKVAPGPEQWRIDPNRQQPQFCLLSNGHYSLTVDSDGNGGASWNDIMLTRWTADRSQRAGADQFLIKDLDSGELLSLRQVEAGNEPDHATTSFGPHRVDVQRCNSGLMVHVRLAIASQHDVEARKLILTNELDRPRRIMVISQAELAMASRGEFERHPAFSRLFVESQCLNEERMLLFRRRPRSSTEKPLYLAHGLVLAADSQAEFGWDTQRSSFQGRCRTITQAVAGLNGVAELAGHAGAVLDPAIVAGVEITIPAYGRVEMAALTGVGRSRRQLLTAMRAYRSLSRVDWLFEQAYMQSAQELHNLHLKPREVPDIMRLYTTLMAPEPGWRHLAGELPPLPIQLALFARGISGDWPITLAQVGDQHEPAWIESLLKAHTFLSGRQWISDLVLIDETAGGYGQPSRDYLRNQVEGVRGRIFRNLSGGVHVISGREMALAQRQGLMHAASLVLSTADGHYGQQFDWNPPQPPPTLVASRTPDWAATSLGNEPKLEFDNGYGGYDAARREYLVRIDSDRPTPAPWCNVIANPDFGVLIGSGGSQCTWADNSSENRITPWLNDPVGESSGEILYLRDEETGEVWSPLPGPAGADGPRRLRHGLGYSVFEHAGKELMQTVEIHVDQEHPVKVCRLTLSNRSDWTRRITATYYLEWVLGTNRADNAIHLRCEARPELNALFACNPFSPRYGSQRAFLAADLKLHGYTACRSEFLGYRGSLARPSALGRLGLSGRCLPGVDPCGAIQVHLDIPPGQERSVSFLIGQGNDPEAACRLIESLLEPGAIDNSRHQAEEQINALLSHVRVETPEPAFDQMINHWLPWQALMGRLWGRTGYYQSSGAFGFRDQLQDVLALLWLDPEMVRAHLLRAASRQFAEGDVLHWWHEGPLRGVRTRCSDDLLWLPYAVAHYVQSTGDKGILDEPVPYLAGEPLPAEESERYSEYSQSERSESLYEHCKRAIDHAATVGPHGLPTIGNGDWNDGFNRISITGRGESVWLAWFLIRVLKDFASCCEIQGEGSCADIYRQLSLQLLERIESVAWDGAWYQRAYFDDGQPLGSAQGDECRIDLIAQAWSVLGQDKLTQRSRQAMASALEHLVDEDHRLIKLLTPPFDTGREDPGYIKGYPPGIRENGAQYTHAATWGVWAMARLGDGNQAMHLFRLLNPLLRATQAESCEHYRLEPYVLAGDIYSVGQNRGRGGWSWYTGAAAWLYRAGLEALLGLQRYGDRMHVKPCLPPEWPGFTANLRLGSSLYRIEASRLAETDNSALDVSLDGVRQASNSFPFIDDGQDHLVELRLPL